MKYLVKAAESRRVNGGIWRARYYFTLEFHLVELDEQTAERIKNDPNLVVKEFDEAKHSDMKYIPEGETEYRPAMPPPNPNSLVEKMLKSGEEEEDEDDTKLLSPQKQLLKQRKEADEEAEKSNDEVEKLMKKSERVISMGQEIEPGEEPPVVKRKHVTRSSRK